MDIRRAFSGPTKNSFASDYINNKRSKVKFAGTSNLASTVSQQGGALPLMTPSGALKPYQGTYGFSSATPTQGAPPSAYCLNQSRSYRDLLDITKGKYLLTPPNPTTTCININQVNYSRQLFCGTLYQKGYTGVAERVIYNNGITGPTGATGVANRIIYNPLTNANQWITVDPSFNLFYNQSNCSNSNIILDQVNVRQNSDAQRQVDRFLNLDLTNGFDYPVKFLLDYNPKDCINSNNDLQPGPYPTCPP
jgi:hypothetical protein